MSNKIIAIDYDGTIALNSYPGVGEPNWAIINKAKEEQAKGATLILWTCREGKELDVAVDACSEWGLYFDVVNENPPSRQELWQSNPRKIYADEYWDDHAVSIKPLGEWLWKDGKCFCSVCHKQGEAERVYQDGTVDEYPFCSNCGASMVGHTW